MVQYLLASPCSHFINLKVLEVCGKSVSMSQYGHVSEKGLITNNDYKYTDQTQH